MSRQRSPVASLTSRRRVLPGKAFHRFACMMHLNMRTEKHGNVEWLWLGGLEGNRAGRRSETTVFSFPSCVFAQMTFLRKRNSSILLSVWQCLEELLPPSSVVRPWNPLSSKLIFFDCVLYCRCHSHSASSLSQMYLHRVASQSLHCALNVSDPRFLHHKYSSSRLLSQTKQ